MGLRVVHHRLRKAHWKHTESMQSNLVSLSLRSEKQVMALKEEMNITQHEMETRHSIEMVELTRASKLALKEVRMLYDTALEQIQALRRENELWKRRSRCNHVLPAR